LNERQPRRGIDVAAALFAGTTQTSRVTLLENDRLLDCLRPKDTGAAGYWQGRNEIHRSLSGESQATAEDDTYDASHVLKSGDRDWGAAAAYRFNL